MSEKITIPDEEKYSELRCGLDDWDHAWKTSRKKGDVIWFFSTYGDACLTSLDIGDIALTKAKVKKVTKDEWGTLCYEVDCKSALEGDWDGIVQARFIYGSAHQALKAWQEWIVDTLIQYNVNFKV